MRLCAFARVQSGARPFRRVMCTFHVSESILLLLGVSTCPRIHVAAFVHVLLIPAAGTSSGACILFQQCVMYTRQQCPPKAPRHRNSAPPPVSLALFYTPRFRLFVPSSSSFPDSTAHFHRPSCLFVIHCFCFSCSPFCIQTSAHIPFAQPRPPIMSMHSSDRSSAPRSSRISSPPRIPSRKKQVSLRRLSQVLLSPLLSS